MLTENQKRSRLDNSRYLLSCYEDDPEEFMDPAGTLDETSVHHFDRESKSKACGESTLAHPVLRNLREFLPQGR